MKFSGNNDFDVMKLATFFYPGYYCCDKRNRAAGVNIDEWALLKRNAKSVFLDTPEIIPALGYTDCSDPTVLRLEADLAFDHGVDAFIFNYYHDGTAPELDRPLRAFAEMPIHMNMAINLCCHMPKRKLPFRVGEDYVAPYAYWNEEQFAAIANELCTNYLINERYLRCEGCPVITLYHVNGLRYLYGPEGIRRRIDILRSTAAKFGLDLHIVGLFSVVGGWKRLPEDAADLPFDSYSCYIALPDFESAEPIQSYPVLAQKWLSMMSDTTESTNAQTFLACIGAGWNATPRGAEGYDPKIHGLRFPYYPVVVDDEPYALENYLTATAANALLNPHYSSSLLLLGPWNEWSEGCYLLPDARHGLQKLEAVKRSKERLKSSRRVMEPKVDLE